MQHSPGVILLTLHLWCESKLNGAVERNHSCLANLKGCFSFSVSRMAAERRPLTLLLAEREERGNLLFYPRLIKINYALSAQSTLLF